MFTGIIEEIGTVHKIKKGQLSVVLEVCAKTVLEDMKIGDSIAVNGVCLTVTALILRLICCGSYARNIKPFCNESPYPLVVM